ncbi:MAG: hypothetical protein HUK02_07540, partial [Bacteroidaceae bacterium]|nr:hypothetical protein [Bacteroidaceae bacterium]
MKKFFLTLFVACASLAQAQEMPAEMMQPLPTDPSIRIGKLDNGLTYY